MQRRPTHKENSPPADFAAHQYFIDAALANLQVTEQPTRVVSPHPCKLYNSHLNSDGYARIRYSVPGNYRVWDDGEYMLFNHSGRESKRKKLVDYRVYVHKYVYWRHHGATPVRPMEISHLCNNRNCGQIHHMVSEQHVYNLSRIGCLQRGVCTHVPPCLN